MPSNGKADGSSDWEALYEAAIMEFDRAKLPQRITDAQNAITDRIESGKADASENQAMRDAMNALGDLRRMAHSDGHH